MRDSTIILSNHHRRSPYFEDTLRRLHNDGWTVWVQETGGAKWGQCQGPYAEHINSGTKSYDQAMILWKRALRQWQQAGKLDRVDRILFLDNDCFLSGTNHLQKYIQDFIDGGYDFASHHVSEDCYNDHVFEGDSCIAEVKNQTFEPADIYPGFCPNPHWENAYMLITKELYNKLSEADVGHGRKWIKAMVREGAKLGAHKAEYRLRYSHFGDEWFHVGNLMHYYYKIERGDLSFSPDSELDMSRLGYFNSTVRAKFKQWFGPVTNTVRLPIANEHGNYERSLEAWDNLISGTCMENWESV